MLGAYRYLGHKTTCRNARDMTSLEELVLPTDYAITVRGHLADHWSAWFDGLTITNHPNGEAVLTGPIQDQAALHGVLAKLRDLGVALIAVQPAEGAAGEG